MNDAQPKRKEQTMTMTATLGMTLRLDERGIYDCDSQSYIHKDGIDTVADNVIAWLDRPEIITTDDFTGEYASDWDSVVAMFDEWEEKGGACT